MTVPLRAALYLRVSTARQAEHDVSIPDQKRQGEAYCQSRGYQLAARERIRISGGGYRREHLRALAQRVEVADKEVRIMGSKGDLLRTLAASSGVKPATPGVHSSVPSWRKAWDSNPR